jgi:hypothetical protein
MAPREGAINYVNSRWGRGDGVPRSSVVPIRDTGAQPRRKHAVGPCAIAVAASPALDPVGDIICQRADDAHGEATPQDAEHEHRVGAFYKFSVDQMGHSLLSTRPPADITPKPARS